jgi:hypothetical protein
MKFVMKSTDALMEERVSLWEVHLQVRPSAWGLLPPPRLSSPDC